VDDRRAAPGLHRLVLSDGGTATSNAASSRSLEVSPKQKIAHLSTGDRQKVGILLGVCHRPALLLLDEPMSSLDPIARARMLDVLLERLRDDGCTVVISSHILNDVEKIVDWIVALDAGRVTENAAVRRPAGKLRRVDGDRDQRRPARRLRRAVRPQPPGRRAPGALRVRTRRARGRGGELRGRPHASRSAPARSTSTRCSRCSSRNGGRPDDPAHLPALSAPGEIISLVIAAAGELTPANLGFTLGTYVVSLR
jgi:energy-coupling factor transporter ATP-binding protein EcfA2